MIIDDIAPILKKIADTGQATVTGLGALAKGSVSAESIVNFSASLGSTIPFVGNFSGALKGAADVAIGMARDLQAGTQYGVYFQENVAEFGKTVLQARDSTESWQARLEKSATSLNQLGLGMDASMKAFGNMAKQLQDTPLAMQLEATGIKAEELNDVLALSISARKFADFNQERTSQMAINSALNLSKEMDELARFTGMSRKQQQEQLEAELKKPDVAALMLSMTEEQAASFLETSAKLGAQAENVRDLFAEYATGGIRSEQGAATAAALEYIDPRINRMMEESARLSQSGNEEDRKRAAELSTRVSEMISGSLSPDKLKQIAILARSGDTVAEQLNKIITETKSLGAERAAEMELFKRQQKGEVGLSLDDVKREMAEKVKAEREAVPTEETGVYRGVTGLDRFGKDVAALASTELPKLNEAVGGVTKELFGMQGALRARTVAEMETSKEEVFADVRNYITKLKESPGEAVKEAAGEVYDGAKTGIREGLEAVGVPGTWIKSGGEAVENVENKIKDILTKLPSREQGSPGSAGGKMIEDWGKESLVKLHGREGIITEAQLAKMHDSTQTAIGAMSKNSIATSAPSELSIDKTSIDALVNSIKGPFSSLESRLQKLSEKDINRLVADSKGHAELDSQIRQQMAGKTMFLDPTVMKVQEKLRNTTPVATEKDRKFDDAILKQIETIQGRPLFASSVSTVKLADESTKNLKESISKSSDEYKNLTTEVVAHGSKTQTSMADHAKLVSEKLKPTPIPDRVTPVSEKPKEPIAKPVEPTKPVEQYKWSAELTRAFSGKPIVEPAKPVSPFTGISETFRNIGESIVKQVNNIGNVILGVPDTVNNTLKTSQGQIQNAVSGVGTSFEDSLKKTIAGLGVTPITKPTITTGSYNPYAAKTQELSTEERLTKTLSNLGVTTFGAAPKQTNFDMTDSYTKLALEQKSAWEKIGGKLVEIKTPRVEPRVITKETKTEKPIVREPAALPALKAADLKEWRSSEMEKINALFSKAKEKTAEGDTATAKIYEETAKRQMEKLKSSMTSIVTPAKPPAVVSTAKLGPGADMAAINAKRAELVSPIIPVAKTTAKIDDSKLREPAKRVKEAEQNVVTTSVKEKAEMPKTKDLEKIVTAPKPVVVKEPEKPKPIAPFDQTSMSDLKSELVELNKNMRILIAHTDEVADNSKKQVRATHQSATNNIIG